jgi:hypothetical protein
MRYAPGSLPALLPTKEYDANSLKADGTQTIVVTPGASAVMIETHVVINIGEKELNDS